MGKNPNFTKLYPLFEANSDFSLTEKQYEKLMGAPMPTRTHYLLNGSAVMRAAKESGFQISLNEKMLLFKKIK